MLGLDEEVVCWGTFSSAWDSGHLERCRLAEKLSSIKLHMESRVAQNTIAPHFNISYDFKDLRCAALDGIGVNIDLGERIMFQSEGNAGVEAWKLRIINQRK